MFYAEQPQQGKPCFFHHKHGNDQVSGCIPATLIIPYFPTLLQSLVTTVKFLQVHKKLIQIVKMPFFFFQAEWLSNQTDHTDNPMPVPTQNTAQNYTKPDWVKQIWNHTHRKYTTNSNSPSNWSLAKLPTNRVYNTLHIWEADIRLLISKLRHTIHVYKVSWVWWKGPKTPLKREHPSSWWSFYSKFHRILYFRITTAAF